MNMLIHGDNLCGCSALFMRLGKTKDGTSNRPFRGVLPPKGRHECTVIETLEQWDRGSLVAKHALGTYLARYKGL